MSAFKTVTVLEALRTFPVANGIMVLEHEVPQAVYRTRAGRTARDEHATPLTHGEIIGYSVYSGRNAEGNYTRVVAHKATSHVMTIIGIKGQFEMTDKVNDVLFKDFSATEIANIGDMDQLAAHLCMMYLGHRSSDPESIYGKFVKKNGELVLEWLPNLSIVPYLSKFYAHEMCLIDKDRPVASQIRGTLNLSSTELF